MAEQGAGSEFERARRAAEERALVESAKRGSKAAFATLYRNHVGKVYGLCLRMTANRATAEDCAQEAFIQAWRSLPRFEGRSAFGTWLHRIAVNAVMARGRSPRGRGEVSLTDEDGEDREFEAPKEMDAATPLDLERAITTLPPGARDVLVLYGVYGYSHEETADLLGVAVGTCKAQLHRARRLLRERMHMEAGE